MAHKIEPKTEAWNTVIFGRQNLRMRHGSQNLKMRLIRKFLRKTLGIQNLSDVRIKAKRMKLGRQNLMILGKQKRIMLVRQNLRMKLRQQKIKLCS